LNNVRLEPSRTFGNKKREYLKKSLKHTVGTKMSEAYIDI